MNCQEKFEPTKREDDQLAGGVNFSAINKVGSSVSKKVTSGQANMLVSLAVGLALLFSFQLRANVVGSDAQNFNPTSNGLDFVTVQSSETLSPGIVNLGVFFNHAVNTFPYFPAGEGRVNQSRTKFNDSITGMDLSLGLGLSENWDFGLSFPYILNQEVDNVLDVGVYSNGLAEYRINTKYRFFGDAFGGLAAILSANFNRIQNNPFAGLGAGPTTNLELAWDGTFGKWAIGANVGYRLRQQGRPIADINIDPIGDQYLASIAASRLISSIDTKIIFEIFNSWLAEKAGENQTDRDFASAEFLAGVKHDLRTDLSLHAGAGTELEHGASSPDWRVYVGVNWNFGPVWRASKNVVQVTPTEIQLPYLQFITATAIVSPESETTLDEFYQVLALALQQKSSIKKVVIEGHTDSVGSDEYNAQLSQLRAETIKAFLRTKPELAKIEIQAIGYGESVPIADNGNYQGRAKNRRVGVKLQ